MSLNPPGPQTWTTVNTLQAFHLHLPWWCFEKFFLCAFVCSWDQTSNRHYANPVLIVPTTIMLGFVYFWWKLWCFWALQDGGHGRQPKRLHPSGVSRPGSGFEPKALKMPNQWHTRWAKCTHFDENRCGNSDNNSRGWMSTLKFSTMINKVYEINFSGPNHPTAQPNMCVFVYMRLRVKIIVSQFLFK